MEHILFVLITSNVCDIDIPNARAYLHAMDPMLLYRTLGAMIRRRRKTLGLTQAKLAGNLGVSRASVANVETGRQKILVHQLYRYAKALEMSVVDFLPPNDETQEPTGDLSDLPLPEDLSSEQRAQIARVLRDASSDSTNSNDSGEN